jgi:hypothetical protein
LFFDNPTIGDLSVRIILTFQHFKKLAPPCAQVAIFGSQAPTQTLGEPNKLAALGEMSAVLGHELRNPLTALKGHAQLLVERLPDDHPGYKGATTVVNEATRMENSPTKCSSSLELASWNESPHPPARWSNPRWPNGARNGSDCTFSQHFPNGPWIQGACSE